MILEDSYFPLHPHSLSSGQHSLSLKYCRFSLRVPLDPHSYPLASLPQKKYPHLTSSVSSSHPFLQIALLSSSPRNPYLGPTIFLLQVCHNAVAAQSCGPGAQTQLQVGYPILTLVS